MDVRSRAVSSLGYLKFGEPGESACDNRKPERLKNVQEAVVKQQIEAAGEKVL
jgi:hypothetical protein